MLPLTVDDLLPLEEYVARRKEFFDAHRRYIDRYRRIRIGPTLTLVFENRQTLWFRIQEIVRIARLSEPRELQMELNLYNRLLPGHNLLQAALLIEITDPANIVKELAPWRSISGDQLNLRLGSLNLPAYLVTSRPEDRATGTAHWIQFIVPPESRDLLTNTSQRAMFTFNNGTYQHQSPLLSEEFRQSLLDDLVLSDRDSEPLVA
jgi:hypothetical protein